MIHRIANIPITAARWIVGSASRSGQNVVTALVQIASSKGRSLLTTLGIVIAVTSTISVVSAVQGFGSFLTDMVQSYGTQFMVVRPYVPSEMRRRGMHEVKLDMADVHAVRRECSAINRISPFIYTHDAEVVFGSDKTTEIPVRGVSEQYQAIRNFFVDKGRFFGPVDIDNSANVAVLGRSLLKLLQCDESIVGEHIYIDDIRFLVTGILAPKGSSMEEDQDKTIMIPYTTALKNYPQRRNRVTFLVEAYDEESIPQASEQLRQLLRSRHHLQPGQPDDFRIERQDQALKEYERIRNYSTALLVGIVSVSLLVGGIGIMNMMLVSVSERTREIGLRKSIGARRRDIMVQFITEAMVLCTVGGLIGVTLGYGLTHVASLHPDMVDISVPLWSVLLALGFSAGTGIIFGLIPAFKAAILNPIEALRHE